MLLSEEQILAIGAVREQRNKPEERKQNCILLWRGAIRRKWLTGAVVGYTNKLAALTRNSLPHPRNRTGHGRILFVQCIQAVLRSAHGTHSCLNHRALFDRLHKTDAVLGFNWP